ncbi:MAG: hypothetical protein OIF32_02875, partial [Campylobacterales bacterium]|nr:hypothetical protein [Campylobacterales bacterium]
MKRFLITTIVLLLSVTTLNASSTSWSSFSNTGLPAQTGYHDFTFDKNGIPYVVTSYNTGGV